MRQPIYWHLQRAVERYGEDLPMRLTVARPEPTTPGPTPPSPRAVEAEREPDRPARDTAISTPIRTATGSAASRSQPIASAAAELPPLAEAASLDELAASIASCTRCKLHRGRTQVVFGEGDARAELMFVGEAPGAQEDRLGRPFVGPAGQLLTKIIENAVGLTREQVYIANVNKCRPPDNRNPEPDEVAACLPILRLQIELIRPKLIVALGRVAAANLLGSDESVTRLRGRELSAHGVPVVVTWHPAYLLRMPSAKAETWEDIKRVNRLLGRDEVPRRASS